LQDVLRTASTDEAGTSNALGDKQLVADLEADTAVFAALRACGAVEIASSEERPIDVPLGGSGYSVAFDPLDGSSIIGVALEQNCSASTFDNAINL
jgi:sedoheptulose-bisphosphatase